MNDWYLGVGATLHINTYLVFYETVKLKSYTDCNLNNATDKQNNKLIFNKVIIN